MDGRSIVVFIILSINFFLIVQIAASETKFIINCTTNDLRNINEQYKKSSSPLSFVFSQCDLPTIPDALFVNVSAVKSIDFQSSAISTINENAFNGLTKLQVLRIVGSPDLTRMQLWTTHNLDNLSQFDLHNNSISKLDENALRRYKNLKHLNLQDNRIDEIPIGFLDLSFNLEILNLAGNLMERIESDTFKALLRLIDLNLAHNQINFIDSYAFTTTTRLKILRLNGNQIKSINSMVFFNLNRLAYVNLSENALNGYAVQEDAFKQNAQLLHLDLSHNTMFTVIPNALTGLSSLQVLNASNNQLVSIALNDLGNLKNLDISNNKLTHLLDNQFAAMASIESINVSHNELTAIQRLTFTDLKTLQTLDLSANRLQSDNFLELAAPIQMIHLQDNAYKMINLSTINSIGKMYLNNNPWNCTWLLNALAKKEHFIANIQFGTEVEGIEYGNGSKSLIEELDCYDYRQSIEQPTTRRVIIVNAMNCGNQKDTDNGKKKWSTISTYPRTFNKLLSDEFDYKACLLWTVVAVFLVIGLVRLGKFCLDQSEKKSERYRIVQQEKVLKDIDEYFSKNNRRQRRS